MRPERAQALLASLAAEPHLERTNELEVARAEVEDLLHAGPRIEECEEERVIAATIGVARSGASRRARSSPASRYSTTRARNRLKGTARNALAELEVLGMVAAA